MPKRLRIFFRYDRELNSILFRAAAEAVDAVLVPDGKSFPGMILTLQTAGESLNFNPHLHGLLADGTFDEQGVFTPFAAIDTERIAEHFRDHVLAELVTRGLITDEVPAQILSQEHSGFGTLVPPKRTREGGWVGDSFTEEDRTRFVARYIERGPLSLEKLSITDDIVSYSTNDGRTHEFDALEFLALLSCHNLSAVALREGGSLNRMSLSLDTTDGTRAEPGGSAQSVRRFSTTPLRWRREQYPQ